MMSTFHKGERQAQGDDSFGDDNDMMDDDDDEEASGSEGGGGGNGKKKRKKKKDDDDEDYEEEENDDAYDTDDTDSSFIAAAAAEQRGSGRGRAGGGRNSGTGGGVMDNAAAAAGKRKRKQFSKPFGVNSESITGGTGKGTGGGGGSGNHAGGGGEKKRGSTKYYEDLPDPEAEFETVWLCSECREAECLIQPEANVLLICDGKCRRLFHYPCVGLSELPPPDEPYICPDCSVGRHRCSYCQDYGVDDEDVWLCSRKSCGLFFHEACLAMHNVEVITSTAPSSSSTAGSDASVAAAAGSIHANEATPSTAPSDQHTHQSSQQTIACKFVCPAHNCWTCTQTDLKEQERDNTKQQGRGKRGKGANKGKAHGKSSFDSKTERFLYRCIECPRSYHAGCIPPMAKFHELALLCHEHAEICKLPELDSETSLQGTIEKKLDEQLAGMHQKKRSKRVGSKTKGKQNPFFTGVSGNQLLKREEDFFKALDKRGDLQEEEGWFCLPCDVKDEVYSKPPNYKHRTSNQYHPTNRPAKIISKGEVCQCVDFCGDDCLNRMLYMECWGDASKDKKGGNCRVGPSCGNRVLGQRKFKKCQPKREHGKGWGCIAVEKIMKGELVQEYVGEIIDSKEKERRLSEWTKEHPNDPNFYIMELIAPHWYIDARNEANLSRFINHSCDPNCILHRINVGGYIRNGIFALHDIAPGEFLSYDYQFDTKLDRFECRCGAKNCRGNMRMVNGSAGPAKKTKTEIWEEAKARYERDKKFLSEHFEAEESRRSQVDATVPCAENPTETVASGPQGRFRTDAIRGRIFLWRNAVRGSDFKTRLARLEN